MDKFCALFYFKIFLPNYDLDLHSYGQHLSLFLFSFKFEGSDLVEQMIGEDTPENSPDKSPHISVNHFSP